MLLELKQLNKTYGTNNVLNQISAQFTSGLYGLLGANGTGKTTLLNLISHFTRPDEGQILLDGHAQSADFYQHIGFLPSISAITATLQAWTFCSTWQP